MSTLIILVILIGNILVTCAVSVQLYNLHKSVIDLKKQLDVKECDSDSAIQKQMQSEVGALVTESENKKEEKAKLAKEESAREQEEALKRESTIFEGETVGTVLSDIRTEASSAPATYFKDDSELERQLKDEVSVTNNTQKVSDSGSSVDTNTEENSSSDK